MKQQLSALEKLLWKQSINYRKPSAIERESAQQLFEAWRDRYAGSLARLMRVHAYIRKRQRPLPRGYPSAEWCNAAIHLLTVAPENIQDYFLRAGAVKKNKFVLAVLADGGIRNPRGVFIELPPL